ncbi:MAG: hypothetical protein HY832_03330 [Candidatus Aenigmarchaeota archaeon]|nr:hypothetical protein [Candidatus Aenigmarchaeota archaeon]
MTLPDILSTLATNTVTFIPNLVAAIVLLVIGLIVGKVVGKVVYEALERFKVDYYVTEMQKPPIKLSDVFSVIARWWVYLAFISAALSREVLGISSLALWVAEINAFIPRIIGAAVVVIVGYVIAEYIKMHLKKTKSLYGLFVGKTLFFFIVYVAIAMALPLLGLQATLVNNILLVIIASVGLGVAIAMGLGLKDAVADFSKRYFKQLKV